MLAAPQNGSIDCTGRTTGNICNFDCDEGFQLVGSATRICAFSSTWTGTTSFCQPRLCDVLAAPTNGAILAPCYQEFGSTCNIVCLHGYMQDGPSEQTCVLRNNQLVWTIQSQCKGMYHPLQKYTRSCLIVYLNFQHPIPVTPTLASTMEPA